MQSSAENLHYVFDIGDHPTVVTWLPIAAESFKLKSGLIVQMDGRKAKFSQFIFQNCSPAMLLTKCLLAAKSLIRSHSGSKRKALPKKP